MTHAHRTRRSARLVLPAVLALAALTGCGRLDQLTYDPPTTPEQWCAARPCVDVGGTVFNEPLGSLLVFVLAAMWIGVGVWFLARAQQQRSRVWLGVALILGGIGTGLAGISYQAFSYELKCAGRSLCLLTNGFEVGYSVAQAASVSAMLIAVTFACTIAGLRRGLIIFALANVCVYLVVTAYGVLAPNAVALSFTVLTLFEVPALIIVIIIAARRRRRTHDETSTSLLIAALLLIAIHLAYFGYWMLGLADSVRSATGVYFSENDVLHVGMILWLIYVWRVVGRHLRDAESVAAGCGRAHNRLPAPGRG